MHEGRASANEILPTHKNERRSGTPSDAIGPTKKFPAREPSLGAISDLQSCIQLLS